MTADPKKRGKLLVVDDERVIADTLSQILRREGYEVRAAYSGEEAIEVAAGFHPDMLISDMKMGGMNGLDAACLIVEANPRCSVLLISGHLTGGIFADERIERHGFSFLAKPVSPRTLIENIAATLAAKVPRPLTVINVDDTDIARYTITRILQHAGFLVKEAANGAEALELAKTHPDVILLDVHLPDISGFEVCRQLRERPDTASIPIVHLTNTYRDEASRELALRLGADEYLTQPVEPEPLIDLLKRLANARRGASN